MLLRQGGRVAAGACCGRLQRLLLQGTASNELHCNSRLCPAGAIAVSDVPPGQLQWSGARHGACAAACCAARHAMRTRDSMLWTICC